MAPDDETPTPDEQLEAAQEAAAEEVRVPDADADEATEVAAAEVEDVEAPEAQGEASDAEGDASAEAAGEAEEPPATELVADQRAESPATDGEDADAVAPKGPVIPGADLEVDIVLDGEESSEDDDEDGPDAEGDAEEGEVLDEPITASVDLAADARYRATGKRKTAIARVTLKPGNGAYTINGKTLDDYFPRATLQRTIRQPLETVNLTEDLDVVARLTGGGVSAQAGALRHGISRALLDADPNLRSDLKRRGFLTRDSRAKERKKAGLKKARKRPQFSKR